MSTTVIAVRISYTWFAGTSEAIVEPAGTAGDLLSARSYQRRFAAVQRALPDSPFLPPWFRPRGQRYWRRYLESKWPKEVTPVIAWRNLTPLRMPSLTLTDTPANARVSLDRYIYPHGIGAILEATWSGVEMTVDEAIKAGIGFRHKVGAVPDTSAMAVAGSLDDVIDLVARRDTDTFFGPDAAISAVPSDPVSICTVLSARGEGSMMPVQGDAIHRRIDALATWSSVWEAEDLPKLADATVEGGSEMSYLLYGGPRSRVVWYPETFSRVDPALHLLACYHRNLALATMQADSVAAMTIFGEEVSDAGTSLGGDAYDIVRLAATALGRMYGGAQSTYRSKSIKRQIDDHAGRADIDALLRRMNLGQLAA